MVRRMSVREARAKFSELLGSVHHTGEPVAVERYGKTVAYVVSPDEFERTRPPDQRPPTVEEVMALRGIAGKLKKPLPWKEMLRIAREDALIKE
jgi:prevent-host-death family protein